MEQAKLTSEGGPPVHDIDVGVRDINSRERSIQSNVLGGGNAYTYIGPISVQHYNSPGSSPLGAEYQNTAANTSRPVPDHYVQQAQAQAPLPEDLSQKASSRDRFCWRAWFLRTPRGRVVAVILVLFTLGSIVVIAVAACGLFKGESHESRDSKIPAANTTTTSMTILSATNISPTNTFAATSSASNQPISTIISKPVINGWSYKGCYTDNESRTIIGENSAQRTLPNNTNFTTCAALCDGVNSTYMGMENGVECYCGNTIWQYSVSQGDVNCTTPCSGNASEQCGGFWTISVYEAKARRKISDRSIILFGSDLLVDDPVG